MEAGDSYFMASSCVKQKKDVIWGAGLYGGRLLVGLGRRNVSFFIDQDSWRKLYAGLPVKAPDELSDTEWGSIYIHVPFNYYDEISAYLKKKGLKEGNDYTVYYSRLQISKAKAKKDLRRYKNEVSTISGWENRILIWGRFWQKKEYIDFFSSLKRKGYELALISEAIWFSSSEAEELSGISTITAPIFADEETIVNVEKREGALEHKHRRLFRDVVLLMAKIHKTDDFDSCEYTVNLLYEYILYTIHRLGVSAIICLSSMLPHHKVLTDICNDVGIRIIFSHQGVLPGTISVDTTGEVGESIPSKMSNRFFELPVNEEDVFFAKRVVDYLVKSGLNRKVQPKNDWKKKVLENMRFKEAPVILYAGQNDLHSHMVPYTERTKDFFSPIFKTTEESVFYIAEICEKNEWNLVYKPHPMYTDYIEEKKIPPGVIYIPFGDVNEMIDYSNVLITILSSSNYIALIRRTPVVMLGYNQIRGAGCVYEAYEKCQIEQAIKKALKNSFTVEQQEAFSRHVACLLKYYLYDDMQARELKYGKQVPDSIDGFFELEDMIDSIG